MNELTRGERSRPKADCEDKLLFGKNIERARLQKGYTRPQLAKLMGITLGGVSAWEYGRTRPDLDSLRHLCRVLNVSSDSLLGIDIHCDETADDEARFLNDYRRLPANEKRYVEAMVRTMNETMQSGQRPNIVKNAPPKAKIIQLPLNPLSMCAGDGEQLDYDGETEYVSLIESELLKDCDELVRVNGHSMEPAFGDGDLALVRHTNTLNEGDIGVFVIDGEGMIKQYKKDGLHPLNKAYSVVHPDPFASFKCFGKVIGKVTDDMIPQNA